MGYSVYYNGEIDISPELSAEHSTLLDEGLTKNGSCPKSVIDDKGFRGKELWLDGSATALQRRDDRAAVENPKPLGCLRFGTQRRGGPGFRAGASTHL